MITRDSSNSPGDEESIDAIAAAWLAERDDGLTPEEETKFALWKKADPRHEAAVQRLEATWNALQQLRDFRPEARAHPDRDLLAGPRRQRLSPFPAVAAMAAAVAIAATVGVIWWRKSADVNSSSHPQLLQYATTIDGYQRITLEDGSTLELNGSSVVKVRFTSEERRVLLTRGEAHFAVAKDKSRPFWVQAGNVSVRAVGTEFNVRMDHARVAVLVTEGKVQVDSTKPEHSEAEAQARAPIREVEAERFSPPAAMANIAVVGAGQRIIVPMQAVAVPPRVEIASLESIREQLSWQGPRLLFVDTPLAEVVAQFNRGNRTQLLLGDRELESLPIGGSFRAEDVEAFVRLLVSGNEISIERPDSGHIVLRKLRAVGAPRGPVSLETN